MPQVISNASPLIGLASINHLDILKKLYKEIVIPQAVYNEVVVLGEGKSGSIAIKAACNKWIKVVTVKNTEEVAALMAVLDNGESEVIALGQELKADILLLDNKEPRLFAKNLNFKVIGTVGIITLAWKKKILKNPLEEILKLRLNGFWISEKLIERIKREINVS